MGYIENSYDLQIICLFGGAGPWPQQAWQGRACLHGPGRPQNPGTGGFRSCPCVLLEPQHGCFCCQDQGRIMGCFQLLVCVNDTSHAGSLQGGRVGPMPHQCTTRLACSPSNGANLAPALLLPPAPWLSPPLWHSTPLAWSIPCQCAGVLLQAAHLMTALPA